jgi:hypothetical protein
VPDTDTDKAADLPPGLGTFKLERVHDVRDRVPKAWSQRGGVFMSMAQGEAMWLAFTAHE